MKNKKTYTFYSIIFDEADLNCNIISRNAIDIKSLELLKNSGEILDYEIDSKGIKITKEI